MNQNISADHNLRELALTVARNEVGANLPLDDILAAECLSPAEYTAITRNAQFQAYKKTLKAELEENGFSFAAKCRVLAEDLLSNAYNMAKDVDTPAAVRLKALENLVDWGDLKPKVAFAGAGGPGYSIVINIPGAHTTSTTATVIDDITTTPKTPKAPTFILPSAPPKEPHNPYALVITPATADELSYYEAEAQ